MKKLFALILAFALMAALAVPAMAAGGIEVNSGSTVHYSENLSGSKKISVAENGTAVIDENVRIELDNASLQVSGTLQVFGKLSGYVKSSSIGDSAQISFGSGAVLDLTFEDKTRANDFFNALILHHIYANLTEENGEYRVYFDDLSQHYEHSFDTRCEICGKPAPGGYTGSVLSEGNLTIILCVACAAVFGIGGFAIGRAKKKNTSDTE